MKCNTRFINIIASACLMALPLAVYAGETGRDNAIPSITSAYTNGSKSYMLALNDVSSTQQKENAAQATQAAEFEPATFSGSNAHKYLGLGTLALVVATALAPKPDGDAPIGEQKSTMHARFGRAAAVMAAATVTSGLLAHWDDFHLEDGLSDPDNLHALLGTTGALVMLAAVSKAPEGGHAGKGMVGGVAMAFAIKLNW